MQKTRKKENVKRKCLFIILSMQIINVQTNQYGRLQFVVEDVDVSFANALRRTLLSDIELVVFRTFPHQDNQCTIHENVTQFTNEFIKQRLSCIPIMANPDTFPVHEYVMELQMTNDTEEVRHVTTEHFQVRHKATEEIVSTIKTRELFPPNPMTNQYIDVLRLRPPALSLLSSQTSHDKQPKPKVEKIRLECGFGKGCASDNGMFNAVSTCTYYNTPDTEKQDTVLAELRARWIDEGKTTIECDELTANWKVLDAQRIYKPSSFTFTIETACFYSNEALVEQALKVLLHRVERMLQQKTASDQENYVEVVSMGDREFAVYLKNEGYTLGMMLDHAFYTLFVPEKVDCCGFLKEHPHDAHGKFRVLYKGEGMDVPMVWGHVREALDSVKQTLQEALLLWTKLT